jgi:hypothetical protein
MKIPINRLDLKITRSNRVVWKIGIWERNPCTR